MSTETTVIYNETCPICSREIEAYRASCTANGVDLKFEPIGAETASEVGLTRDEAARRLHVLKDGQLLSGVDAFVVLWKATPGFKWLGAFVGLPGIRQVASVVYEGILAPVLYGMHRRRERRKSAL